MAVRCQRIVADGDRTKRVDLSRTVALAEIQVDRILEIVQKTAGSELSVPFRGHEPLRGRASREGRQLDPLYRAALRHVERIADPGGANIPKSLHEVRRNTDTGGLHGILQAVAGKPAAPEPGRRSRCEPATVRCTDGAAGARRAAQRLDPGQRPDVDEGKLLDCRDCRGTIQLLIEGILRRGSGVHDQHRRVVEANHRSLGLSRDRDAWRYYGCQVPAHRAVDL